MHVYDNDDWTTDRLVNDIFHIYPRGEDAAQVYERTPESSDLVLFDTDERSMVVTGFEADKTWGFAMHVYLINKADALTTMFVVHDAVVNGYVADPFWATAVLPCAKEHTDISRPNHVLEENGITDESIDLPMHVYEYLTFISDKYVDETFTITPW